MCGKKSLDSEQAKLPTRLIDVGSRQSPHLKLCEGHEARGWYAALSHCWGDSPSVHSKLELATHRGMKDHIDMRSLPRSYRDAVEVARLFDIQYLWIDSLCIIQDDTEDWDREASKMASVYENALFTIAAASSRDSEGGLFTAGCSRPFVSFRHLDRSLSVYRHGSYSSIKESALNNRAWALQEWILSPRIVHFTADGVFWECTSHVAASNNDLDLYVTHLTHHLNPKIHKEEGEVFSMRARAAISGSLQTWTGIYEIWARLVEDYSSRKLTYPTDKFVGLAGLTRALTSRVTDIPIAGLWRADFHLGLLWSVESRKSLRTQHVDFKRYKAPECRGALPNIPSWSWASVDGPVHYNVRHGARFIKELEIINISSNRDARIAQGNNTQHGRIKAKGIIRQVHVTFRGPHDGDLCFDAQAGSGSAITQTSEPGGIVVSEWYQNNFGSDISLISSEDELILSMPPYVGEIGFSAQMATFRILSEGREKPIELLHGRGTLDRPRNPHKWKSSCCYMEALLIVTELRPDNACGGGVIPYANHVLFLDSTGSEDKAEYERIGVGVFWARHGYFEGIAPQTIEIV